MKIIAVSNRKLCERPFLEQIERVCQVKPQAIILREKDLAEEEYRILSEEVLSVCKKYEIPCILHKFWKTALELECTSVHLPLPELRELPEDVKTQKCSISDPESGWFRKGEHKHVFAYAVETACDKHGWILGYTVHPGNEHDSRTFKALYDKISKLNPQMVVADAGYKTPAIAHQLLEDGIQPLFPYTRPKTKEGFFGKHEFAYDEYYDCYICPGAHILTYSTTNRSGYKEYKSCGEHCAECQYLSKCTESKDHIKLITRHVWEEYMEVAEDIRHTIGNRQIYQLRKETIERIFGTAKEQHGFRYTQYVGKARMEMKAGLTFACMNLKKLAKILEKRGWNTARFLLILKKIKRKN